MRAANTSRPTPRMSRSCRRTGEHSIVEAPSIDMATKAQQTVMEVRNRTAAARITVDGLTGGAMSVTKTGIEPTHGDKVVSMMREMAAVLCTVAESV